MVEDLKEKRLRAKVPDTLMLLAMKAIAKNHSCFLGRAENPFENLRMIILNFGVCIMKINNPPNLIFTANTIVQTFLKLICVAIKNGERLIPESAEQPFVLQLHNPSVQSGHHHWISSFGQSYLEHLMVHCPRIKTISPRSQILYDIKQVLDRSTACSEELIFFELSCFWKNLISINLYRSPCTDDTLRLLLKYLPKLE